MRPKDLKIRTRLMAGFLLILVLVFVQGLYSVAQTSRVNAQSTLMTAHWMPAMRLCAGVAEMSARIRAVQSDHLLSRSSQQKEQLGALLEVFLTDGERQLHELSKLDLGASEKKQLGVVQALWKTYRGQAQELLKHSNGFEHDSAAALLGGAGRQTVTQLGDSLHELAELASQGGRQASERAGALYAQVQWTLILLLMGITIIGLLVGWSLSQSISRGLAEAVWVTREVARGRLDCQVPASGKDEIGQLLANLTQMRTSLVQVVTRVRQGSDSVCVASGEIALGNQDLSARTERQASALQEAAASMAELSLAVTQNSAHARQASESAQQALAVAIKGGVVVGQVVDTMRGINQASRKIAEIIAVIDGIAFQTNILALNAAVEAARAGAQGLGFAVVASEVRGLAVRSAQAAKEIKDLIGDSVSRVDSGTTLAQAAGHTMDEVVAAIQRVNATMNEIRSASEEQSQGVAQVSETVQQMDQVTQQNAALVEEMAAAATSLNHQTAELVGAVGFFELAGVRGSKVFVRPPGALPRQLAQIAAA